jgi:hypothetical protein
MQRDMMTSDALQHPTSIEELGLHHDPIVVSHAPTVTCEPELSEKSTHHFLLLLGISQTCQFQDKSFLKFLLSKELDLDAFQSPKRVQTSRPVSLHSSMEGQ